VVVGRGDGGGECGVPSITSVQEFTHSVLYIAKAF